MSKLFYHCAFGLFLAAASCLFFWELLELLFRGCPEQPAPRPEAQAEPDPWDELEPEDRAYLKWFHK